MRRSSTELSEQVHLKCQTQCHATTNVTLWGGVCGNQNNFDLNFVLDKTTPGKDIISAIKKTDLLIQKVELFDIYESEEKLA